MMRSNLQIVYEALTDGKMRTRPELEIITGLCPSSITQALCRLGRREEIGLTRDPKWTPVKIPYKYYGDAKPAFANRYLSGWQLSGEEIKKWKEGKRKFD